MSAEKPKCTKCDSTDWGGFMHCKICGSYFIFAKCKNCDNLRLEKCPIDGGELEFNEVKKIGK